MSLKKSLALLVLGIFAAISIMAVQARPAFADGTAYWRLVHAAPDISSADVFVDGVKLVSNFDFGTISGYVPTPAGTHTIQIAVVGQGIGAAVMTQTVTVQAGLSYTLVMLGSQSMGGYFLSVYVDDNAVVADAAKVRAYQLAPDAGLVDIHADGSALASRLAYQQVSGYVIVPAGAYTFDVTATQKTTMLPASATLDAGSVVSVFTLGLVSGTPQFQVATANAVGLPGMPQTGSDPNALPVPAANTIQAPLLPWLLGAAALLGVGFVVNRRLVRRQ